MTPPPAITRTDATDRIAAMLGGMLWALLSALLGLSRLGGAGRAAYAMPAGDDVYSGVIDLVARAEAAAEFAYEPWVEWEAVPAPWRNGRLLPRRHEARRLRPSGIRPAARMRGPPAGSLILGIERTGMT